MPVLAPMNYTLRLYSAMLCILDGTVPTAIIGATFTSLVSLPSHEPLLMSEQRSWSRTLLKQVL